MQNEFSRPVPAFDLPEVAVHRIAAGPAERAALAARFGLLALDRLEAEIRLRPIARGVRLEAEFEAEVVQECVVTLEPVANRVGERFTLVFGEAPAGADEDNVVEPIEGETLDLGETVAQQLSLALDPYPRAPGAAIDPAWTEDASAASPFAALAKLRRPEGEG
jgi:uncharacterized metal-binding protein YceD (DUF177 family)